MTYHESKNNWYCDDNKTYFNNYKVFLTEFEKFGIGEKDLECKENIYTFNYQDSCVWFSLDTGPSIHGDVIMLGGDRKETWAELRLLGNDPVRKHKEEWEEIIRRNGFKYVDCLGHFVDNIVSGIIKLAEMPLEQYIQRQINGVEYRTDHFWVYTTEHKHWKGAECMNQEEFDKKWQSKLEQELVRKHFDPF